MKVQQVIKNRNKILFHTKNIFSKQPPYDEYSHSLEEEITKVDLGFIQL